MLSPRTITLVVLLVVPLLVYLGLGAYALWQTDLFVRTFWILPGMWLLTWIVSLIWKPRSAALAITQPHPVHLTPEDTAALEIVRRYQLNVDQLTPGELTDPRFYVQLVQEMAGEIARHYHPKSSDPVSELTVPELLAAVRLAVDDMERWMLAAVPGSRLLTIRQWNWLQHAPKWVRRLQNTAWATSVLINPANIVKYLTSQATVGPVTEELQTELLAAVYLRFVRQTGFYLIEMNSGRLRGGADLYRKTFGTAAETVDPEPSAELRPDSPLRPESLTVALVGQVNAGKSSLINALIGSQVARTDVLPETRSVSRHQLSIPDSSARFTLLDTPGYADSGATPQQISEMQTALREADVVLLLLAANAPARAADKAVIDELRNWYRSHRKLKPPPVLACLTHIDLLSPVREWSPPYDWKQPDSDKARNIQAAVQHVRELFADIIVDVIPVCTDVERQRQAGIFEELLTALTNQLSEGQAVALLRTFHEELDRQRIQRLLQQVRTGGRELLKIWLEERLRSK